MTALLNIRFMFYLVLPTEIFQYKHWREVPNFTECAIWFMIAYIVAEVIICQEIKKIPHSHGFFDCLSDLTNILLLEIFRSWSVPWELELYEYIYANHRIVTLPHTVLTFLFEVMAIDFFKYWTHRATHEISFLWNMHRIHHSSEHLNLIAAMRACIYQEFVFIPFYCLMAFAIPTQRFFAHMALNTLFTFWTHTQIIPKLGFIEKIFVTASHHRVHHGRNRSYIDTNYGTALIIWDRLFGININNHPELEFLIEKAIKTAGTFSEETDMVPISFGLVKPLQTFNMVAIQWDAKDLTEKVKSMDTIGTKAKALVYGPRWKPGTDRLGDINEVEENLKPSGKPEFIVRSTLSQNALILTQFLSTIYVVVFVFTKENDVWPNWVGFINSFFCLYHFGYLLDNNEKLAARRDRLNRFYLFIVLAPLLYWKMILFPVCFVVLACTHTVNFLTRSRPKETVARQGSKPFGISTAKRDSDRVHHKFG